MADDKTFTQADIDKAKAEAEQRIEAMDAKVKEALDEAKRAKAALRAASEIKPEDLTAAEERADKAEARAAEAEKSVKTITAERDKAVKALETEQTAARGYALEAELASAIAEGNVIPSLVPGFKAMMAVQAKADLVDGKYSVTIGDKPAREAIKTMLDSDDGKAWRAAPHNNGGGAPGSKTSSGGKTMTRAEFDALDPSGKMAFSKEGGKLTDAA